MEKKIDEMTEVAEVFIKSLKEAYESTDKDIYTFLQKLRELTDVANIALINVYRNKPETVSFDPELYAEGVNELLSIFLDRNIEEIKNLVIGQSVRQNIKFVEVIDELKIWNEIWPNEIDLSLFNDLMRTLDLDVPYQTIKTLKECIYDIKEVDNWYHDDEDEDDMYHYSKEALYLCLLGDAYQVIYYHIRPDGTPLHINYTAIQNAVNFYELWSQFDFDDFLVYIDWGTDIKLPENLKAIKTVSDTGDVYAFRLHKYRQNLEDFSAIKEYLEKIRTEEDHKFTDNSRMLRKVNVLMQIISYLIDKTEQERQVIEINAKLDERNRILANLSHSIKNMLKSVIDPLINLREEIPQKAVIIDNAIKGANLIREIVNAINLSFQTTLDDLKWDVEDPGMESMSLQDMVVDSLRYSISNMFDSRYFPAFSENYFPRSLDKAGYDKIKQEWNDVSAADVSQLKSFLDKHMFHLDLNLDESGRYHVGNEKSSAIKLLILFQEIIFNAVKYSSYVPFSKRKMNISLASHNNKMELMVKNSFDPRVQAKTTGVGMLVIENFAKILGCVPLITRTDDIYSISLNFNNIWRKDAKNPVH
ncbi:MAG: hypothetical protein WCY21_05575 [Candidatus Cloacimonadaceae bacterium]|jgi:hypothetical protein|nr:hypothetical protein [Candidatus Cloacimonadota bacterium]MDX9949149.1 hypothetical protein [Candidatus Syntrophosphaera sp.]